MRLWKVWIVVIAVASGPWYGLSHHAQWQRVTWIPFRGAEDKPRDIAVNFLMWVPFGWSFVAQRPSAKRVAQAAALAASLSLAVEIPQLYFRLRDPSATDVYMGVCGTVASGSAAMLSRF